jgi:hypothetical protein
MIDVSRTCVPPSWLRIEPHALMLAATATTWPPPAPAEAPGLADGLGALVAQAATPQLASSATAETSTDRQLITRLPTTIRAGAMPRSPDR